MVESKIWRVLQILEILIRKKFDECELIIKTLRVNGFLRLRPKSTHIAVQFHNSMQQKLF